MYGIISTARSRLLLFLAASRLQLTAGQCGSSCWMSTDPFDTIPFGDIPVISKEIQLIGNNLLDIDYFRTGFARLATVVLKGHPRITVFPNFDNIAFALQDLTIQYTSMRTIKPHNLQILLNLRYLDMSHNQLVSPIPDMDPSEGTWLRELQLVNNSLNEVPHLAEIGLGLKKLNIGSNEHITHANKHTLALYTNVMFLGIAACKLTTVPDFRILSEKSLASSLEINLEGNEITDLDPGTLAYLNQSNWSLFLAYNPISRIPNMIHVDLQIKVELAENPILCNCEAAWLKVAGSLTAFNLSAITCAGPEAVKGQKISDLITDQLYCQGKERSSYIEAFQANKVNSSIPVLPVRRTVTVDSLIHCANLCLRDPGCIMFAFRHVETKMGCGITDADDYASVTLGSHDETWGRYDVLWFAVGTGL